MMGDSDNTPVDRIAAGKTLHRQGRLDEAEAQYLLALANDPDNADAAHLLGVIANQRGDYRRAAALIGQAIERQPGAEHFHCNLGVARMGLGNWAEAEASFMAELAGFPNSASAHANMGALLQKRGDLARAIAHYQDALAIRPDDVTVLNNLGAAYAERREFEPARALAERSLGLAPNNPDALNVLGLVCRKQGRPDEALKYFEQALDAKPAAPEIHFNMGVAHKELADDEKALACFDRALALKPDYPEPHFSRGLVLLAQGAFEAGWKEYEYGLLCGERQACNSPYPRWQGEALAQRTLLCCAEQGLGDEIMFASVLPEIIEQAGHCVVECDARLVPLYRRSFPSATVVSCRKTAPADFATSVPQINMQVPMGSLPLHRRRHLKDFPRHAGYLKADSERVSFWRTRLKELGPGLRVGISWRGGTPKTGLDRRSIPLAAWLPVLKSAGIRFVSLQYTECGAEIAALERAHGIRVTHWQDAIDDYDETAALVCALDRVITVQTAVFHLAGALGRPVWGLLPIPAEWRYMQAGDALPWYPSARLFRQTVAGEWDGVIHAVSQALGAKDVLSRP